MTGPYRPADLAVVLPTRDRWDMVARCLAALRRQSVGGFGIVVVADGEDQVVPPLGDDVTVITKAHAGPGAARNAGVSASAAPLVLLLGDDMIAAPDLVERHLAFHNRRPEPEVAVLGHVDWHPEARRGRIQRWLDWSGTQFDFAGIVDGDAGAGRFYSSNVSVKRSFYLAVGGFDEEFPFVYEDIDLGIRLADKGMQLRYEPLARTWHLHRYTMAGLHGRFRTVGTGEQIICRKQPQLEPYFLERIRHRRRVPAGSPWPWLVDLVPRRAGGLRHRAEQRADAWYLKRLTPSFLTGWTAGAELTELRTYLGERFDYPRLAGRAAPTAPRPAADAPLYRATARVMGGAYGTYVEDLLPLLPTRGRVLHHGCATGTIGLHLLDAGHDVTFAPLDEPSASYLAWRIERRGRRAPVRPAAPDAPVAPGDDGAFDMALVLDLAEAVPDGDLAAAASLLGCLEAVADACAVGLPPGTPRPLVRAVLARAARGTVLRHRRHRERGTLVVYRTAPAAGAARLRSTARRWAGPRLPGPKLWPPVARS